MPQQPTRRARKLDLETEDAPTTPRTRTLKLRSAIHLAERFSQRAPITFVILNLDADLRDKRIQEE